MFRFSVRKNWKVRQVSRVRTVASLVFCLVVRAQADSTARAPPPNKKDSKSAHTAPAAQTFTLVGAGDIADCQHLARPFVLLSGTSRGVGLGVKHQLKR